MTTALSGTILTTPADGSVTAAKFPATNVDFGARNLDNVGVANIKITAQTTPPASGNSDGDRWWDTTNTIIWYYHPTIKSGSPGWVSVQTYIMPIAAMFNLTANTGGYIPTESFATQHDIYLTDLQASMFCASITAGSAYWSITVSYASTDNSNHALTSFTNSADTNANWVVHKASIGQYLDLSSGTAATNCRVIVIGVGKTGSPAALYAGGTVGYKLVHL